MNILKLYHARWKQDVWDEEGQIYPNRVIEYFVQYERENHLVDQQLINRNGYRTVAAHIDPLDNIIFDKLNGAISQIETIREFDAVVHEFRPWHDYEKIERAWASKRAQGYRFNDLNIRSRTHHIVSLATRLRMLDAPLVKNSVIGNIPQLITLEMDGLVPNLIPAAFYTTKITETIIKAYWAEKEDGLLK